MDEDVREGIKYTKNHEWAQQKNGTILVGITDHAQKELTDVVFVELPEVGTEIKQGDELCVVESVKSVSEVYSPVSGKIVEVNSALEDAPETINESPYDDGWLVKLEPSDSSEYENLMDADQYKTL